MLADDGSFVFLTNFEKFKKKRSSDYASTWLNWVLVTIGIIAFK
jgi:hypothetical protein